jgi:hypothetical protein
MFSLDRFDRQECALLRTFVRPVATAERHAIFRG